MITVERKEFEKAVGLANKILTRTKIRTELSAILLSYSPDTTFITTTNLDSTIKVGLTTASTDESGEVLLPAKLLNEILASTKTEHVFISPSKDQTHMIFDATSYTIANQDSTYYIGFHDVEEGESITIDTNEFKSAISKVLTFTDKDNRRPILSGVYFDTQDGFKLVATDSYRLAVLKLSETWMQTSMIVPFEALDLLLSAEVGDTITITLDYPKIKFASSNVTIITSAIEGKYPSYQKIIPESYKAMIVVDSQEILNGVKKLLPIAKYADNAIRFLTSDGNLILSVSTSAGEARHSIGPIRLDGQFNIVLNSKYVTDFVSLSKYPVVFKINGERDPVLMHFDGDESLIYVCMPMEE